MICAPSVYAHQRVHPRSLLLRWALYDKPRIRRLNEWFSFVPVFQWCCLTTQGSSLSQHVFLLSLHLCFIIGFICYLFVAHNDSWLSKTTMEDKGKGWDHINLA